MTVSVICTVNGNLPKDEPLFCQLFCQHQSFAEPVFMFKPLGGHDGSKRGSQVMLSYNDKGGEVT